MQPFKRHFIVLLAGIIYTQNYCIAQEIKYSMGPVCESNKVLCLNPNEVPTCFVLNPKVHIQIITDNSGKLINRYEPNCSNFPNKSFPTCIDKTTNGKIAEGVVLDCVEFVKCQYDKEINKLSLKCSDGKVPKCLGDIINVNVNDGPNCELESICGNNSVPVCDYTWQANASLNRG